MLLQASKPKEAPVTLLITPAVVTGVNKRKYNMGCFKTDKPMGAWVDQLVKHLTFGSGHDLTIYEFEPHIRLCTHSMETAWDSLSPSLSALP